MSREASKVLLASAGTGKTFRLTNQLLALYASDVSPARVLASTFTRKAAGEILQRLILRLAEASGSDAAADKLAANIGIELDRSDATELCVQLLRNIDRLRISTLDAWFKECVQQSALDFGLPPDWEVSDPLMEQRLCARALSRALDRPRSDAEWSTLIADLKRGGAESRVHAGLLTSLSQAGRLARECTPGAFEFPQVLQDPSEPEFEQALAAFEKALLPQTQAGKDIANYAKARERALGHLRASDWSGFAANGFVSRILAGVSLFSKAEIPESLAAPVRVLLRRAANRLSSLVLLQNRALRVLADDFNAELDLATLAEGRLSFDALPRLLESRAETRPGEVGFDHLLLDEFQDTSILQWRALEPSVRACVERPASSFFCVGDVKQSIYAWRDGNPKLLASLAQRLEVDSEPLTLNWRSSIVLLEFVHTVFEPINENKALGGGPGKLAGERFAADFKRQGSAHDLDGRVRLWVGPKLEDNRKSAPRENARLLRGVALALEISRAHPEWSVAFLVRSKKLVPALLERLKQAGLAASGEGGNPLTDSGAVNAVLSLLEFADHPGDDYLLFHLATSPLATLAGVACTSTASQRSAASLTLRRRWLELGPVGFFASLEETVRASYDAFDQRRFGQLLELAGRLRVMDRLRPAHFAQRLAQERVPDPASARIRVMTVHGAKGLEFDAVILLDLDGTLNKAERGVVAQRRDGDPYAVPDVVTHTLNKDVVGLVPELHRVQEAAKATRLFEELCVLYVALTRAIHHLDLVVDFPGTDLAKCSFAGVLLAGIGVEDIQPDSLAYDDPLNGGPLSAAATGSLPQAEAEVARTMDLSRVDRSTAVVAPSRNSASDAGRSSAELFQSANVARQRGVLWHLWMEHVAWSEEPLPDAQLLAARARVGGQGSVTAPEVEAWLRALGSSGVRTELSRADTARRLGAAPDQLLLLREQRFAFLQDPERGRSLVQGAIDRAVIARGAKRAEIVDFKSDALPGDDEVRLRERAERYRPQLELYRAALSRLEAIDPARIDLRVCFLAAGKSIAL